DGAYRSHDRALAAEEARAAEHDRGDRVELEQASRARLRGVEPSDRRDARDADREAAEDERRRLQPGHGQAGEPRALRVAPDGVELDSEARVAEQHVEE